MEECRAESVALYLASNRDIASIFGLTSRQDQDDLAYYTFVVMACAGVRALEWFDPATGRHGQAHMEARLGITNWMLDHGLGRVEYVEGKEGELVDAFVRLDRQAVLEKGKEVMGKLLVELQVRTRFPILPR
jgi:dipeptidyl-peptidase-3